MEEKKKSPNRAKKEKIVAKLSDKLAKSKGLVFTNYQGLTHVQLEKLKKAIKSLNAELVVTKNTLLLRSLQISNFNPFDKLRVDAERSPAPSGAGRSRSIKFQISNFQGPTATLFLYGDPIEPLRQLAKTIKELNLPAVKFGIIDSQNLTSEKIMKLASLPSRDMLIAQLLFQMKAPLLGLHRALSFNIQKLVVTLKAIEGKKQ